MKNNNYFDTYVWACDLYSNTGEGILGLSFLNQYKNFFHKEKIFVNTPNLKFIFSNKFKLKKKIIINNNFVINYIYPFYGLLYLWFYYFKKKKICFLNYLPLWNIFLIILLPPHTILGPITGRKENLKFYGYKYIIRKFIFPFLFRLNIKILLWKYNNLLFSTNSLKYFFSNAEKKRVYFNFVFTCLANKKYKNKKNIDFLIYNRKYDTKNSKFIKFLINNLHNKKIHIIGDVLKDKKLINHGIISREKSLQLLSRAKFTILPEDNLYSLFFLDAAISNVNIFYSSKFTINKNYFINLKSKKIDFKDSKILIRNIIKNNKYINVKNFKIRENLKNDLSFGLKKYFNQFSANKNSSNKLPIL
jgi:hypothetical protein